MSDMSSREIQAEQKPADAGQGGLLTLEEVAEYLRVSIATVRRWTNTGKISCYRIGGNRERRFSPEQVQAFLASHEEGGRP